MLRLLIKYSGVFILITLLQVLVLNNMHLSIFINPYCYILIILILPFDSPGWLVLTLSFFTGLTMDAFSNSLGMHSAATVAMGFARQYLLQLIAPRDGYESGHAPDLNEMGVAWFMIYAGILTLIHHLILFMIEDFGYSVFFSVLFKAILSSVFTLVLLLFLMLFSYKPKG